MLVSKDAEAARAGTDGYKDTQTHKTSTVTLAHARRGLIKQHRVHSEEAGHGHVMYGIIAFQSTGP